MSPPPSSSTDLARRDEDPQPPPWGASELRELWQRLRDDHAARERGETDQATIWDLVVVGAGITGAGVARDAAARGLKVLVLEAEDVAYGTSSRSSRLIHGGVRYLEQAEFKLVFEALRERDRLYELAGHLVRPTRFLFPSYRGDRLSPLLLRLGLTLYDALRFFRGEGHRYLSPDKARTLEPLLGDEGLQGAVWYEDAVTDDARLTLTVLQDAQRLGAQVLTYASVRSIDAVPQGERRIPEGRKQPVKGRVCVTLTDSAYDGQNTQIHATCVVVATGPWSGPRLLKRAGQGLLSLSKGIHVVLRASDCPVRAPVVVQTPGQRRILFAVPWGSRTYLGTTDSAYEGDPGRSQVSEAEEDEVLDIVRRVLPKARLGRDSIISTWSGVRPLVRPPGVDPNDTVELARSHRIVRGEPGVFGIVGGKLTTYRQMAEDVVDEVVGYFRVLPEQAERPLGPCVTAHRPLVPGEPVSEAQKQDPVVGDLVDRHGPFAVELARRVAADPKLGEPLAPQLPYRRVELDAAFEYEGCQKVVDILRRRLPLVLTDPRLGGHLATELARRFADAWGGGQGMIDAQLEHFRDAVVNETRRDPMA